VFLCRIQSDSGRNLKVCHEITGTFIVKSVTQKTRRLERDLESQMKGGILEKMHLY